MSKIDVVLTLTSPLHVAYPGNQDKTTNTSRTCKQPALVGGQVQYIPYYPANGFRGGMRRKAKTRLVEHFQRTEGAIPTDLYLGLSCGASTSSPDSTPLSIEEILRARSNVYMGLFGGGARMHQSAYRVSDMVPILESTVRLNMVPGALADLQSKPLKEGQTSAEYIKPWEITGDRSWVRIDDVFRVMNPAEMAKVLANPVASVADYQGVTAGRRDARKSGEDVQSGIAQLQSIEAVAAGVPFYFSIDFDSTLNAAQVGMLLHCLGDLFRENAFGGWSRCGFGKVHVKHLGLSHDGEEYKWDNLYDQKGVFALPAEASVFTDAADGAVEALKIADMADFFVDFSADAKAEKKAVAKAKKAEQGAPA